MWILFLHHNHFMKPNEEVIDGWDLTEKGKAALTSMKQMSQSDVG